MNTDMSPSTSPIALARSLWRNRGLILALTRREIIGRYRGSVFGLLWSFFNPLLMLAVYTFVFSVVFKSRWAGGTGSRTEFALALFSGLIIFTLFSECFNRSPGLIIGNVNYVKKVVFPLESLPVVALLSAGFHALISLLVWLIFDMIFFGLPPVTILLLPLALLPLIFMTLGLSWLLASLGVYLRDVSQVIGVITTVLMFMTPLFYSIESLPASYRPFMKANPLTVVIEQVRDLMIWGKPMHWATWGYAMAGALLVAWLGFAWFQATRKGFADVL